MPCYLQWSSSTAWPSVWSGVHLWWAYRTCSAGDWSPSRNKRLSARAQPGSSCRKGFALGEHRLIQLMPLCSKPWVPTSWGGKKTIHKHHSISSSTAAGLETTNRDFLQKSHPLGRAVGFNKSFTLFPTLLKHDPPFPIFPPAWSSWRSYTTV